MWVEGVGKLLDDAERLAATQLDLKHPNAELIKAKASAATAIPLYRAALYPEDDDG